MSNYHQIHTCRFCKKTVFGYREPYIKYSIRHYAHPSCFIEAGHTLDELSNWQLGELPFFWLKENGLLEQVEARLAIAKAEGKR
jgi:hypothetical protein